MKRLLLLLGSLLLLGPAVPAANKTFTGPGNFSDPTKWNSGTLPAAGDNLQINGTCTFDNAAASLVYGNLVVGFTSAGTLNWPVAGTNTLNVGAVSSSIAGSTINMTNGGTLQVRVSWSTANMIFTSGTGTISWSVTSGNSTLPAAISTYYNLTTSTGIAIVALGTATTVTNNLSINSGTFRTGGVNLTCNGTVFVTGVLNDNAVAGSISLKNVTVNNGGAIDNTVNETYNISGDVNFFGGNITGNATPTYLIAGNLTFVSGTNDMGRAKVNVAGTTTISGTLVVLNTQGYKKLNDLVVTSTGNFNCSVAENWTINGNIQVNGGFSPNTAVWTFAGNNKTISGSTVLTFDDITCSGTYTNNTSLTFTTSLKGGSGTWSQGVNSSLTATGNIFNVANLNASAAGNTVTYNRSGNQNVRIPADGSYFHLSTGGSGNKTLAAATVCGGNVTIGAGTTLNSSNFNLTAGGNFTNNGTFTAGTATVTLNGTAPQAIGGTTATSFYNLTIANTSALVTANTNFSTITTLTVNAGATLNPAAAVIVSGAGTLTGNGTVRATRIGISPDFVSQYTITTKVLSGLNVDYIGAGNQNVNALSYGSLTVSTNGSRTVVFPAAVVFVSNVFSPTQTTTTYVITGNTINFNGTVTQTIPVFNYNNLTSSSTGARILSTAGTIGIAGVFTPGTNTYTVTGSTVSFNGSAAQNIPAFTFYNLVAAGTNTKSLAGNCTVLNDLTINSTLAASASNYNITLGGNWIDNGTFSPGSGTATVTLNGTYQTITKSSGETFNHLTLSATGTTSLGSAITTNGNLLINIPDTFDVTASNYGVTVKGNFTNNSTFLARKGTVTMSGSSAQTIGGASLTNFYNVTQNNAAGVSITQSDSIFGALNVTLGTFSTGAQTLILVSNASGTARLGPLLAGANFSGTITMQRYLPSSYITDWRQLGTPCSGQTLAAWDDDIITTGFPGSDFPNFGWCSIDWYNETIPGNKDTFGYVCPTNITNPIPTGKGFYVYIGPNPTLLDVTGSPNKFTQSLPLTYTPTTSSADDGWNMVANPYPSTIDWDAAGWTKTNVDNAIYTWNPSLQQYGAYVFGVGVDGQTQYVPSSQAFWVHVNASSPSLSATENVKSGVDETFKMAVQNVPDYLLRLKIKSTSNKTDETVVRFKQGATNVYDGNLDAIKFEGGTSVPYMATVDIDTIDYAINSIPLLTAGVSIPLRVRVPATGTYTISRDSSSLLPMSACVVLEDLLTNTQTDLRTVFSYSFTIADTTSAPRFVIHFSAPLPVSSVGLKCNGDANGMAVAKGNGNGPWDYTWKDAQQNVLQTTPNSFLADTLKNLTAGLYYITVNDVASICGAVTDTIRVNQPDPLTNSFTLSNVSCFGMNDGSLAANVSGGTAPYAYAWSNSSSSQTASGLSPGAYSVVITDNNGCTATYGAAITQPPVLTASFTASNDTVYLSANGMIVMTSTSSGANSYWWDFGDGSPADTSMNPVHYYNAVGTYTVTLIVSNGNCSDTAAMTVVVLPLGIGTYGTLQAASVFSSGSDVNIDFYFSQPEEASVSVADLIGQVLYDQRVRAGTGRLVIPLPGNAAGIYLVRIVAAEGTLAKRVFIR